MKHSLAITTLLLSAILTGCAGSKSGDTYSRDQARQEMTVRMGVVESVKEVTMEGSKSGVGTAAGAVVGGVAGSSMGRGKGNIVGAVIGAVAGGIAGQAIEGGTTTKNALEITVKMDNGQLIAIVQEGQPGEFRAGDRVRVIGGRGDSRVSR
jgi:outer membrane lipoprotein SlyB